MDFSPSLQNTADPQIEEIELDPTLLLSKRIVSHDGADQRSRPYDMLRTQILQSMSSKGWKILGVTSPTPGCGKTVTAVNLAFSMARQPDQSVALVDMDLQRAQIAKCLGLPPIDGGLLDLLKSEHTAKRDHTGPCGKSADCGFTYSRHKRIIRIDGLSCDAQPAAESQRDYQIIILDLPPILSSDDVIAVLPQIDCVLLVAAVGHSKVGSRGMHETFAVEPNRSSRAQ